MITELLLLENFLKFNLRKFSMPVFEIKEIIWKVQSIEILKMYLHDSFALESDELKFICSKLKHTPAN